MDAAAKFSCWVTGDARFGAICAARPERRTDGPPRDCVDTIGEGARPVDRLDWSAGSDVRTAAPPSAIVFVFRMSRFSSPIGQPLSWPFAVFSVVLRDK